MSLHLTLVVAIHSVLSAAGCLVLCQAS
jgi:hypothetical protein